MGNKLWSVDKVHAKLMTFTDSLIMPVISISPADQTSGTDIRNINLEWFLSKGATKYEWQLDYDTDFSDALFTNITTLNSVQLIEQLKLATTYYWRVRVIEPILSPWSNIKSFTTNLGGSIIAPSLRSPGAGAKSVDILPIFQWGAMGGADNYELMVSTNYSFTNPIINKTLPTTAWQSDTSLECNTTYYWKVRASSSNSYSSWSAVSAFTTKQSSVVVKPPNPQSPLTSPTLLTTPTLYNPEAGATGAQLKPLFQWNTIASTDNYELLISTNASFTNPVIIRISDYAISATSWQTDTNLEYDTTYYWKVRASNAAGHSAWSAVSSFTTKSPPKLNSVLSTETSPLPASIQLEIPKWMQYLFSTLIVVITFFLITMLVIVMKMRRPS
ncbi:MAG: hypothetical protein PHQ86_04810 [Dehalococcoidales bacterium]|nr:hypothetical protein [Dehalococcoidales bacterium]